MKNDPKEFGRRSPRGTSYFLFFSTFVFYIRHSRKINLEKTFGRGLGTQCVLYSRVYRTSF